MTVLKYKWQQLAEILREKIDSGVYSRGSKLPSERQLCGEFSVSRDCVRMVLNHLEDEGYIVRLPGRGAFVGGIMDLPVGSRRASKLIGLTVFSRSDFAPTARVMEGISEVVRVEGYHLIVEWMKDDLAEEREVVNRLLRRGVDGLILTGTAERRSSGEFIYNSEFYNGLYERYIPFVLFDRFITGENWSTISYQVDKPVEEIVRILLASGKRRIAYLGVGFSSVGIERYQAYLKALRKFGITPSEEIVILADKKEKFNPQEFGWWAIQQIMKSGIEFDGVMTFSDAVAYGAYRGGIHRGWKGEGKYLGGYGRLAIFDEGFQSALITTEPRPLMKMAKRAAELLLEEIRHHGRAKKVQERLPVRLFGFDNKTTLPDWQVVEFA